MHQSLTHQSPSSPPWLCHASPSDQLDEIDPMTGEVISGSAAASIAPDRITTSTGYTWAYRRSQPTKNNDGATNSKLPVVCLHGLGSQSYAYRNTIRLLAEAGHDAIALDWIGHGASDKPVAASGFDYSIDSYVAELQLAISQLPLSKKPFALMVQGYVLGQVGLLYALRDEQNIAKLIILNTPLALNSKLRPELGAYQNPIPFLRPKAGSTFAGDLYNAAGGPYALNQRDADAYNAAYQSNPAASQAIEKTMASLQWSDLLRRVDGGFVTWKKPSLVVWGGADQFLDISNPLNWLDSKRTCMKMATGVEAKLGHSPCEDFPEAIHPTIVKFLAEEG